MSVFVLNALQNKGMETILKRYAQDFNWIHDNYRNLLREFPEKYVAVMNKKVCFSGKNMQEIVEKMNASGADPTEYAIELITAKPKNLLL
jgi:hypothetical protein